MLSKIRSASIFLILSATSLTAGCAWTGRHWSGLVQGPLSARHVGTVPGSRERIEALQPGSQLVITLKNGACVEGAFKAVEPAVLALTDRVGHEFSIPMLQIEKIVAPGTSDSLTNGIAIGAGIGLGAALAILAAVGSQDGDVLPSAKVGAPLLLSGVGGLVGAFVDRGHKREQLVYRAR